MFDDKTQKRFWSKVDKSGGPDACWPWLASTFKGRGRIRGCFYLEGGKIFAHRFALLNKQDKPFADAVTRHSCDNPLCVNPAHLEWGTQLQNVADRVSRGRCAGLNKTHCIRGHPLSGDNLLRKPSGRRNCRTCTRENDRRRRHKGKESGE